MTPRIYYFYIYYYNICIPGKSDRTEPCYGILKYCHLYNVAFNKPTTYQTIHCKIRHTHMLKKLFKTKNMNIYGRFSLFGRADNLQMTYIS